MKFVVALLLVSFALASAQPVTGDTSSTGTAPAVNLCQTGLQQSPIDVPHHHQTRCVRSGFPDAIPFKLSRHYWPASNCTVQQKGRRIEVTPPVPGALGFITVGGCNPCDGHRYDVKSIALRLPADHTIHGKRYAAELQITHQKLGAQGNDHLIITSVFFYKQGNGGFLNGFLENVDAPRASANAKVLWDRFVDLEKLHETFRGEYYTYHGSLTWRGCPETVRWFLYKTPQGMDHFQINAISGILGNNAPKPVAALNNREVMWYRKRH